MTPGLFQIRAIVLSENVMLSFFRSFTLKGPGVLDKKELITTRDCLYIFKFTNHWSAIEEFERKSLSFHMGTKVFAE